MITIIHPMNEESTISKESLAKRLKDSSSTFLTGVFFKGAENSGGNALGALFPIIHLNSDEVVVKDKKANSRKLMKNLDTHGHSQSVSQAIFTEMDSVDVAKDGHKYNTNAVILVGCKILEIGSRVAKGLEHSWKSWTNIGVLIAFLQENEIVVQNLSFLKQIVPNDPRIFMYCILVNMRLSGDSDETKVLAGLQKLRGSVMVGYTALYTVLGEVTRSRSEESMERLIQTVSGDEERRHRRHSKRSRRINSY